MNYKRTVFGVGYSSKGKYKKTIKGKYTKEGLLWRNMLERCYSKNNIKNYPTYKDTIVCEEWHDFQVFADWVTNNYKEGFHLDKDILCKDCKIYSPETCCFVPRAINIALTKRDKSRGKYLIGATYSKTGKFVAMMNRNGKICYLGTFDSELEAHNKYKMEKEKYIIQLANRFKEEIKYKTYQALINYKVEITD
jgi:hypothetical protein